MNFDLLLKGGEVFTGGEIVTADIGIRDGLIVAIGRYLASDRLCPVYDVRGKWVLPAFVELFAQGDELELSKRAAVAGVSLMVSAVTPKPWESPDQTCRRLNAGSSWIDRAYAVRVLSGQLPTYDALLTAKKHGLSYLLAALSPRTDGLGLDDAEMLTLLERARNAQVSVAVWLEHTLLGDQPAGERVQAARAAALAAATGTRVGLLGFSDHATGAAGMPAIALAHSFLLTDVLHKRRRGRWYRMHPPLRGKDALRRFQLDPRALLTFGSGPAVAGVKAWKPMTGTQPLAMLPSGAQAVLAKLVPKKKADAKHARRVARLLSERPFAFAGYAGERGHVGVGSVADLVVFDPAKRARLGPLRPKASEEFNPFMGLRGVALPTFVLNRGRVVAQDGELVGNAHGALAVPIRLL